MFNETIFHPVSGEKGYFVSEDEARFLRILAEDFKDNKLALIEHSSIREGCDVHE